MGEPQCVPDNQETHTEYRPRYWRFAVAVSAVMFSLAPCGFFNVWITGFSSRYPIIVPLACLLISTLLFSIDRVTARRVVPSQFHQLTLTAALNWHGGLLAMMLVFWPIMGGVFSRWYCAPFCGYPLVFGALFAYVGLGSANALIGSLFRQRQIMLRDGVHPSQMTVPLIGVICWLFVIWFGVHPTWEGWMLRMFRDDYETVIADYGGTYGKRFTRWGYYDPVLPPRYFHLSNQGVFSASAGIYFTTYYGDPTKSQGLLWCRDAQRNYGCLQDVAAHVNTEYSCFQLRPHWWRCIVW